MAINDKLAKAFNEQVTMEIEASLIYLQLSYVLDDLGLTGMRDWMKAQHDEELEHAHRFAQHLLDRGYVPQIQDIPTPKLNVSTAKEAFEASLAHEEKVSASIRNLAALQAEVQDWDSRPMIDWFLDEQIEEESTVSEILDRITIVGGDGSGLLRIDHELGARDHD
ncbi:ferritin [Corynebacterium lowii]|uniref:Ferritin n=1 Tax=Corynebacterium lowii TaxID=1544413 RepID=A0A0Q0UAN6_9CORY|nr:ferritin [Corynebacterium lowii]KQB84855.1 putative ferritin-1 [Corynebacterium lowii]MDP9851759.1 ferritin [Corynebacterium lowii]